MLRVRVETPCFPTEDPEKVIRALQNLFPDLRVERADRRILGITERLDRLRERIREQRIRDTARRQLIAGRSAGRTTIRLNKQAASVGVVNFSAGSPLGDILVEIESDDLMGIIDEVAASTVEGVAKPSDRTGCM